MKGVFLFFLSFFYLMSFHILVSMFHFMSHLFFCDIVHCHGKIARLYYGDGSLFRLFICLFGFFSIVMFEVSSEYLARGDRSGN